MPSMIASATKALFAQHDEYGFKSKAATFVGATPQSVGEWATGSTPPGAEYWPSLEEFFGLEAGHFARLAVEELMAEHGLSSETSSALRHHVEQLEKHNAALEQRVAELELRVPRHVLKELRKRPARQPPGPPDR